MPGSSAQQPALEFLSKAWWVAVVELSEIALGAENPEHRVKACEALLDYTAKFGIGLGDPFIPEGEQPGFDDDGKDD